MKNITRDLSEEIGISLMEARRILKINNIKQSIDELSATNKSTGDIVSDIKVLLKEILLLNYK